MERIHCPFCDAAQDRSFFGEHLLKGHIAGAGPYWTCADCSFKACSENDIASHCLASGHSALGIRFHSQDRLFAQMLAVAQRSTPALQSAGRRTALEWSQPRKQITYSQSPARDNEEMPSTHPWPRKQVAYLGDTQELSQGSEEMTSIPCWTPPPKQNTYSEEIHSEEREQLTSVPSSPYFREIDSPPSEYSSSFSTENRFQRSYRVSEPSSPVGRPVHSKPFSRPLQSKTVQSAAKGFGFKSEKTGFSCRCGAWVHTKENQAGISVRAHVESRRHGFLRRPMYTCTLCDTAMFSMTAILTHQKQKHSVQDRSSIAICKDPEEFCAEIESSLPDLVQAYPRTTKSILQTLSKFIVLSK